MFRFCKLNHTLGEYFCHRPHYYIAHQYVLEAEQVRNVCYDKTSQYCQYFQRGLVQAYQPI